MLRIAAFTGSTAMALIASTTSAQAQSEANAGRLEQLIQDQQALLAKQAGEIAELQSRLDAIEQSRGSIKTPGSTVGAAAQMAQADASTANAEPKDIKTVQLPAGLVPFAPQLIPPGPADESIAMARQLAANPAGVTTEWGAGAPIFRSVDGNFRFKPRGRILEDISSTFGSRYDGRNITTTGARALRLGIEGAVGTHLVYQFEMDFSDNAAEVNTAFFGWRSRLSKTLDYDVRIGHLPTDRGFDGTTGSDSTPFHERNMVANAIIPQRGYYGVGAQFRLFGPNWHWATTLTGDRIDGDQSVSDGRTIMSRIHWNPVKTDRNLIHIAAWGFDEDLSSVQGTLTRNTIVGIRFNNALRISTGPLTGGTGTTGYGAELGGYVGPLWVMGELGQRIARREAGSSLHTNAGSLSAGFFLTGELPPYNPRTGQFDQPVVEEQVFQGGPGALELTARYEWLSYDNVALGGEGWQATLGLNWYLNSFTRVMLNATHWNTNNRAGNYIGNDDGQTLATRFSVSF